MAENADTILTNSQQPKRASNDSGSFEQHSIQDQIEADRYRRSVAAAQNKRRGIRFSKIVPPGAD
jgi:hypothetical protein